MHSSGTTPAVPAPAPTAPGSWGPPAAHPSLHRPSGEQTVRLMCPGMLWMAAGDAGRSPLQPCCTVAALTKRQLTAAPARAPPHPPPQTPQTRPPPQFAAAAPPAWRPPAAPPSLERWLCGSAGLRWDRGGRGGSGQSQACRLAAGGAVGSSALRHASQGPGAAAQRTSGGTGWARRQGTSLLAIADRWKE